MRKQHKRYDNSKECNDDKKSWIFFVIGLIATVAVRIIALLNAIDPFYGKLAWYIGVAGFFVFFLYKFNIYHKNQSIILEQGLLTKLRHNKMLNKEDKMVINSFLCAMTSQKDKINFFVIFSVSALAMIIALYFDLFA